MMLFDAHCHLHEKCYEDDINEVIDMAKANGIQRMMTCGTHRDNWQTTARLYEDHPDSICAAFGWHPWVAHEIVRIQDGSSFIDELKDWLCKYPLSVVGEIGLDAGKYVTTLDIQKQVFIDQLELAIELDRPVVVHCVKAFEMLVEILESVCRKHRQLLAQSQKFKLQMHAFSGSSEVVGILKKYEFIYFSFCGTITYERQRKAIVALKSVPIDRLVIETDAPCFYPFKENSDHVSFQEFDLEEKLRIKKKSLNGTSESANRPDDQVNIPSNLIYTLSAAAKIKNMDVMELSRILFSNTLSLFNMTMEK